jgi:hypothetical protein
MYVCNVNNMYGNGNNVIIIIMAMYVCTCGNNMYVSIMYVCMYVAAYVCMYVCMYVLMYVCMYVHVYVCNVWYMGNIHV